MQIGFGVCKLISIRRKLNRKLHSKCTPILNRDKRTKIMLEPSDSVETHEIETFTSD